jgi:hypothetical protein
VTAGYPVARRLVLRAGPASSSWPAELHKRLDARGGAAGAADVAAAASWLRVQAVGRDAVEVADHRVQAYTALWSRAAYDAGYDDVRHLGPDGVAHEVEPMAVSAPAVAVDVPRPGLRGAAVRAREWAVDRAEDVARLALRAVER